MDLKKYGIDNFLLEELVPEELFKQFGARSIMFLDLRIVQALQLFRELVGKPVTVNNWHKNGFYNESGFRMPNTKTGGKLSQHKFGRAFDVKVLGMTSHEMKDLVIAHQGEFMALGVTTLEDPIYTTGKFRDWLHFDGRTTGKSKIQFVTP